MTDTPRELPAEVRRAMWALRGGLLVAAGGIVGFFLSYNQVGAPELAAADYHPLPLGAWLSIVAWCAGSLAPGGVLAFSAEAGEAPLTLRESRRFAHSQDYLQGVLTAAGFTGIRLERAVLRHDRGAAIEGFIVTASAPMALRDLQGDGEGAALV